MKVENDSWPIKRGSGKKWNYSTNNKYFFGKKRVFSTCIDLNLKLRDLKFNSYK